MAEGIREIVERLSVKPLVKPTPPPSAPHSDDPNDKVVVVVARNVPAVHRSDDPSDRVVVVAARNALPEYLKHGVYICPPNRPIQRCVRLAFYTNNIIDRRVPSITGQVEAISKEEIETSKDLTDVERERLRNLLKNITRTRSDELSEKFKVLFLSPPESPDTLILPHDIVNNLTSGDGRRTAFTQGQRYVSLARLEKGPETTSELI